MGNARNLKSNFERQGATYYCIDWNQRIPVDKQSRSSFFILKKFAASFDTVKERRRGETKFRDGR